MKPCFIMWSITIFALLFVIDFMCSKNSFGYFAFSLLMDCKKVGLIN